MTEVGEYTCCTHAMFNRLAGCVEAGRPDSPVVWQALADKPNVTDVACGREHTLALLETGQVKKSGFMGAPQLYCVDLSCGTSQHVHVAPFNRVAKAKENSVSWILTTFLVDEVARQLL